MMVNVADSLSAIVGCGIAMIHDAVMKLKNDAGDKAVPAREPVTFWVKAEFPEYGIWRELFSVFPFETWLKTDGNVSACKTTLVT